MEITILLFGNISEIVASSELKLENIKSTDDLKNFLFNKHPKLKSQKFRVAVNREFVFSNTNLSDGDEVSLVPPFGGG